MARFSRRCQLVAASMQPNLMERRYSQAVAMASYTLSRRRPQEASIWSRPFRLLLALERWTLIVRPTQFTCRRPNLNHPNPVPGLHKSPTHSRLLSCEKARARRQSSGGPSQWAASRYKHAADSASQMSAGGRQGYEIHFLATRFSLWSRFSFSLSNSGYEQSTSSSELEVKASLS